MLNLVASFGIPGFPGGSDGKESCNAGDPGSILRKSANLEVVLLGG